jgi:hypothetical protein
MRRLPPTHPQILENLVGTSTCFTSQASSLALSGEDASFRPSCCIRGTPPPSEGILEARRPMVSVKEECVLCAT